MAMATKAPARGLISEAPTARAAASRPAVARLAAQQAHRPSASPARNGHWPMALETTVLTANTTAAGLAPRPR